MSNAPKHLKRPKLKEARAVETVPDAWDRFESAVKTVAPPKLPKPAVHRGDTQNKKSG
jgi:hypothetical protein